MTDTTSDDPRLVMVTHRVVWAMPTARAADASHSSLLRVSTIGGIAIAASALVYFAAELLRVFL